LTHPLEAIRLARHTRRLATLRTNSLDVLVDIVNQCNLRCIMCHFAFDEVFYRRPQVMSAATFASIAAKLRPYARRLTLSAAYEPTVSPHFAEILRICESYAFPEISFLTNGNHLPEDLAETIVGSGVTEVCVSVHAARPDTYRRIMQGGQLHVALRNVEQLRRLRDAAGRQRPRLQFNIALMKSNLTELTEIVELAARVGVESIAFRHLIVFEGLGTEEESLTRHDRRLTNAHIQRVLERAVALGIAVYNSPDYFEVEGVGVHSQAVSWGVDPHEVTTLSRATDSLPSEVRVSSGSASPASCSSPGMLGNIDAPAEGSYWHGENIEVSGWALSPVGIRALHLKREAVPADPASAIGEDGLVELGMARFHNATRSDVVRTYPDRPYVYRAGWSYLLTRSMIAGTRSCIVIRAVAIDSNGSSSIIGVRTLRVRGGSVGERAIGCRKPFDSVYVDAHGHTYPYPDCHTDKPFGSLLNQSLEEIWEAAPLSALRRELVAGGTPEMCRRCPLSINRKVDDDAFFEAHPDFSCADRR
jgi:MoaA/NifB/PqqE/SkfB family radical SAM enzyme